jgi:hypothetical protein
MLPALQAVSSWRCQSVASCQLPVANDRVWCEHLMSGRAVDLSFGLTLNRRRGTNALFWSSLFRGDFSVTLV